MKRRLLTIKDPGRGFLRGLVFVLIGGVFGVVFVEEWRVGGIQGT